MKKQGTYNLVGEKWCNRCKKYQPLHEFGKNTASKDGRHWSCRESFLKPYKETELENMKLVNRYQYTRPDAWDNYCLDNKLINNSK